MKSETLKNNSFELAVRVTKLSDYLNKQKCEYVIAEHIMQSGTQVGNAIRNAQRAHGKISQAKYFGEALSSVHETKYWVDLLLKREYIDKRQYEALSTNLKEISVQLNSIIQSTEIFMVKTYRGMQTNCVANYSLLFINTKR